MNYRSSSLSSAIVLVLACTASAHAANGTLQNQTRELAIQRANSTIQYNSAAVHASANDRFVASDVVVDKNGAEHVRMNRTYRGLAVVGGDFVMHTDSTGKLASVSQTLRSEIDVDTRAALSKGDATLNAGVDFGSGFDGVSDAKLVIFADGKSPKLAYEVVFNGVHADQTPTEMHYFVDANNGDILGKWDSVHTKGKPGGGGGGGATCNTSTSGTGRTLFSGNVPINTTGCSDGTFRMVDMTRGGGYTTDLNQRQSGTGTTFTDSDNS
jgi:zinc metalloprotease ZmpA